MALSLNFSVPAPCAGGNHLAITVNLGAQSRTFRFDRATLREPIEDAEAEAWCRVMLRILVRQAAEAATGAQIRAALNAKTIDLTFP